MTIQLLLVGDAVLPTHRAKGLQRLMITQRLRDAAAQGVTLAMACALPGSASHRNYELAGLHVAYTKPILRLD